MHTSTTRMVLNGLVLIVALHGRRTPRPDALHWGLKRVKSAKSCDVLINLAAASYRQPPAAAAATCLHTTMLIELGCNWVIGKGRTPEAKVLSISSLGLIVSSGLAFTEKISVYLPGTSRGVEPCARYRAALSLTSCGPRRL